jgi:lipopolysaccharide/colanic/teichoic acid biosynthesis glycosyltransferase
MQETPELTNAEKQIFKKRIMLRATLFALILVSCTMILAMAILKLIN